MGVCLYASPEAPAFVSLADCEDECLPMSTEKEPVVDTFVGRREGPFLLSVYVSRSTNLSVYLRVLKHMTYVGLSLSLALSVFTRTSRSRQ